MTSSSLEPIDTSTQSASDLSGNHRRLKVLLSAYSCEPGKGSERGVGWNVAREVAKYHDVWVLTRPDESKDAIEIELERNPIPNLHFVYFTLPFWQDSLRWGQSGAMQLHYYLWQIQAYFVARRLHREIGFNVAHHVTFVRYSCPSFLSLLPIPFIWGPVGGGESAPLPFWADFNRKNKLYEVARLVWRWVGEHDPFARLTAQRSAIVYTTTQETAKRVYQMGASQVQVAPESGISEVDLEILAQCPPPNQSVIRFISITRLLHWKGVHLGLHAFAQAALTDGKYWIVGEGPELTRLQDLANHLGVADRVQFLGLLPRDQVLSKLAECTALVHPSLHDSGGWVCIEAMAAGRPVLCLDLGGSSERITEQTGIKVPAQEPEQAITALAAAMKQIATDPTLQLQMCEAGRRRVRELYTWKAKGQTLDHVYRQVSASSSITAHCP